MHLASGPSDVPAHGPPFRFLDRVLQQQMDRAHTPARTTPHDFAIRDSQPLGDPGFALLQVIPPSVRIDSPTIAQNRLRGPFLETSSIPRLQPTSCPGSFYRSNLTHIVRPLGCQCRCECPSEMARTMTSCPHGESFEVGAGFSSPPRFKYEVQRYIFLVFPYLLNS